MSVVLVGLALPASRAWVLRRAGWALVAEDSLLRADAVVLTVEVGMAGVLEAVDLVKGGYVPDAAVFAGPPDPLTAEYLRRGIPYEDNADRLVRYLRASGVTAARIPQPVTGTEDQGPALARWCTERQLNAVIVVTTKDHSRRLRRVLRRSMRNQPTRVMVRASRYSPFNPDEWWRFRSGLRIQAEETQKLLLDFLRHPFS